LTLTNTAVPTAAQLDCTNTYLGAYGSGGGSYVTSFETASNTYGLVQRTWVALPVLVTAGAEMLEMGDAGGDGEGEGGGEAESAGSGDGDGNGNGNGVGRLGGGVGISALLAAGGLLGVGFAL
jgi:hypothetical protein